MSIDSKVSINACFLTQGEVQYNADCAVITVTCIKLYKTSKLFKSHLQEILVGKGYLAGEPKFVKQNCIPLRELLICILKFQDKMLKYNNYCITTSNYLI